MTSEKYHLISSETQYDLQYISIEITNEVKKEIVSKLGRKRKAVYNKSFNMKRGESETEIKTSKKKKKKKKMITKFTISKIKK